MPLRYLYRDLAAAFTADADREGLGPAVNATSIC
jgi:hypothetical protein